MKYSRSSRDRDVISGPKFQLRVERGRMRPADARGFSAFELAMASCFAVLSLQGFEFGLRWA
jgi:hypothetical protein